MSYSFQSIKIPPISNDVYRANSYTYGCPIDGITFYAAGPINIAYRLNAEPRINDDRWHYNYITYLPNHAGWIMSDPKESFIDWNAIIRINPHKGLQSFPEFEEVVSDVMGQYVDRDNPLLMARMECKIDVAGWEFLELDKRLWVKNGLTRITDYIDEGTVYYGKNRTRSQVRVYDKAAELGIDVPGGLTRVEGVYSWIPDRRPTYSDFSIVEKVFEKPFDNMVMVDIDAADSRHRVGRGIYRGLTFTEIYRGVRGDRKEKNFKRKELRDFASAHTYFDLKAEFRHAFWNWFKGETVPPAGVAPEYDSEATILQEQLRTMEDTE